MSSIRPRIPRTDDPVIIRLVKDELFPFARLSMPDLSFKQLDVQKRLARGKTFMLVDAGKPIGFVHLFPDKTTLWIDMLAITRSFQGQGAGTALMEKAESYGREKGLSSADLFVDKENQHAQLFYLKRGFDVVRFESRVNCFHMSKPLA